MRPETSERERIVRHVAATCRPKRIWQGIDSAVVFFAIPRDRPRLGRAEVAAVFVA